MHHRLGTVLAAIALAFALAPAARAACVTDADCDNGDTCNEPDVCDNGTCVLGGGGDTDNDLVCDADVDADLSFNLTRVVLKKQTSGADNSVAKGSGDLFAAPGSPAGAFVGTSGFTIRVKDSLSAVPPPGDGVDVSVTWAPSDCTTKSTGVISCRTPDGHSFVKFKPNPLAEGQYRFKFKMKRLGNLAGPFFEPVRMVLRRSGTRLRGDQIADCHLILAGLVCREF